VNWPRTGCLEPALDGLVQTRTRRILGLGRRVRSQVVSCRILARGSGEMHSGTPWNRRHVLEPAAEKTQVSGLGDACWTSPIGLLK
jgi:hypothetical protein